MPRFGAKPFLRFRGSPLEGTWKRLRGYPVGFFQVFSDPTAENRVWSDRGATPGLSASGW